jgi:alanine racemase
MKAYIVEREDLGQNIEFLKKKAGDTPIWAVLKGNGYGIGLVPLARLLAEHDIHHFCVAEVREAEQLRENGFAEDAILMLRSTSDPGEINQLLDMHVLLTVGSYETAVAINGVAAQRSDIAEVHLKLDTGMGRYGFLPTETEKLISIYQYMKNIAVSGIYTHFSCASSSVKETRRQYELFRSVIAQLQSAGYETGMLHCCNSSAFLRFPEMCCDGVRLGSALLGRLSFRNSFPLKKIGYAEATVEEIRWLPKGHTVGYGAAWRAKNTTRVAVVGIGWYNGFGAERQNDVYRFRDCLHGILGNLRDMLLRKSILVNVNGHKCRVLGHISMVHTMVDVTDIGCAVGDKVILQVNPLTVKGLKIQYR